jgi:hypothetical protein
MPGWRSWSPRRRRRLRREIETDERIVRVLKLSALWYSALRWLMPLYPYLKVEVAAVGEGEAFRFAQGAVDAALHRIGEASQAEPHIAKSRKDRAASVSRRRPLPARGEPFVGQGTVRRMTQFPVPLLRTNVKPARSKRVRVPL